MSAPIVVPPSQYWDGNDGPWSSFTVRVGSPEKRSRVMVSTAGHATWVVLPDGCAAADGASCPDERGGIFRPEGSTTWADKSLYNLALEENLNYTGNGRYGFDRVGLSLENSSGPSLDSQVVAGIVARQFWLGIFGLGTQRTNFTTFDDSHPSYMTSLKAQNKLPSLSWAYTAGAPYRLKKVFGSLTLGGYDASRFVANEVTFPFAPDISRDLVVGVQSIVAQDGSGTKTTLLPQGILSFIDSTIPYIWLPVEACQAFEGQLGLTWDDKSQLYLVNDTLHDSLVEKNYTFTFRLGNSPGAGEAIDIVLPYAAFDLMASYPLVTNKTRYFPLKRAANDTQYTLGRAFLQEAYLIADYERSNFSIAQARFEDGLQQKIVAIHSTIPPSNTTGALQLASPKSGVNSGVIAGIVIAVVGVGVLSLLAFAFFTRRWPFARRETVGLEEDKKDAAEIEGDTPERSEMATPYGDKLEYPGIFLHGQPHGEVEARHKVEMPAGNHVPEVHGMAAAADSPVAGRAELEGPGMLQELAGQPAPAARYFKGAI
ncbi:MAG: hypothetical protein M1832_003965 [Thelocarpon impressellum]|nr:MAG: hypothetical protein M1832_003965 [Thelocarpon impressellum]